MASPIRLYIAPNCGLEIDLDKVPETDGGKEPNDSAAQIDYYIRNSDEFVLKDNAAVHVSNSEFKGSLSPTSNITLPGIARRIAGIPREATRFSFISPPPLLAPSVDWPATIEKIQFENLASDRDNAFSADVDADADAGGIEVSLPSRQHSIRSDYSNFTITGLMGRSRMGLFREARSPEHELAESSLLGKKRKWALLYFAVFGGFVYFDKEMNVLSVNCIVAKPTKYNLYLVGPYKAPKEVINGISSLGRDITVPCMVAQEAGFVARAWIRPYESFQGKHGRGDISCGSLLYMRDDGSAVTFSIFPRLVVDPSGQYETFADALRNIIDLGQLNVAVYTHTNKQKRKEYDKILMDAFSMNSTRSMGKDLPLDVIHIAFRSQRNIKDIKQLILMLGDEKTLSHKDHLGWTPLHYACRFHATNVDFISMLIDKYEDAVIVQDTVDRFPLHLACTTTVSVDVINLLLDSERNIRHREMTTSLEWSPSKLAIQVPTLTMKRLPLHLACNRNAPVDVIKALLNANIGAIRKKTSLGRIPLHIAIQKKMSTEVIAALLKADSSFDDDVDFAKQDISQPYRGLYPLQMACLNDSPMEIVDLLLSKDEGNNIVRSTIPAKESGFTAHDKSFLAKMGYKSTDYNDSTMVYIASLKGMNALQLALNSGSADNARLLLQKEKVLSTRLLHREDRSVDVVDNEGRTALHIACKECVEPDIIKILLELDRDKKSVTHADMNGNKPLHYVCDNTNAHAGVIKMLLEAEYNKYHGSGGHSHGADHTSAPRTRNTQKEVPLFLAIKSNAPDDAISQLLDPHFFTLDGFDRGTMNKFGTRINNNVGLQKKINKVLCRHKVFFVLWLEVVTYILSITLFMVATKLCVEGKPIPPGYMVFLYICAFHNFFREMIQMHNEGLQYLTKFIKLIQLIYLGIFFSSLVQLATESAGTGVGAETTKNSVLYIITTFTLIVDFLFTLRTLFLPFANFIGGVILIVRALVPFFIVSITVIMAFVQTSYLQGQKIAKKVDNTGQETEYLCQFDSDMNSMDGYKHCANIIFTAAISGVEDHDELDPLGFVFAVFVSVILLNVLIAIVSDAWDDAGARAAEIYWQGRVEFLSEVWQTVGQGKIGKRSSPLDRMINRIPNAFNKFRPDTISWNKDYPYSEVESMEQYNDPRSYFGYDEAKAIVEARSLASDIYWIRADDNVHFKNITIMRACLKWIGFTLLFIILVMLGTVTGGLFWSLDFRLTIISYGTGHFEEEEDVGHKDTGCNYKPETTVKDEDDLQLSILSDTIQNRRTMNNGRPKSLARSTRGSIWNLLSKK